MAKKRIGVVLAGCGVFDGAEIHEATLTLYFLDRAGVDVVMMAPDQGQREVINHLTGEPMDEQRNVLVESARIARGKVVDIATVRPEELDALILPGGFGMAKNLSDLALAGPDATVNGDLIVLLKSMHQSGKPIGAICISPAVVSKVFADRGITVTIGTDEGTAGAIRSMGNQHENTNAEQIIVDEKNRIVSTAAYMCAANIGEAGAGIEKLVKKIMEMV
ncbi:MAG: isoprenoid biosynthesis glyoxalase ElbB [Magnetococcales bacterium]|nr:isoprenoid biosynthesis glyoxalase ElbB [Magnetococcales bacterium]